LGQIANDAGAPQVEAGDPLRFQAPLPTRQSAQHSSPAPRSAVRNRGL